MTFLLVVLLLGFYATIAQALLIREAMVVFLAGELKLAVGMKTIDVPFTFKDIPLP